MGAGAATGEKLVPEDASPDHIKELFAVKATVDAQDLAEKTTIGSEVGQEDEWSDDEDTTDVKALPIELEIAPDVDVDGVETERNVMIRIRIPEGESPVSAGESPLLQQTQSGTIERAAMDVCCVIDISGSMRNKATYEVDGLQKDDGLSYLDIVKHAVKAVMGILQSHDRFTLVAFDHQAEVVFALHNMSEEGRVRATEALDKLSPRGRTDIWAGLACGIHALQASVSDSTIREGQRVIIGRDSRFKGKSAVVLNADFKDDTVQVQILEDGTNGEVRSYFRSELKVQDLGWRQKSILLLTDGQVPIYHQPVSNLREYKESHPDFHFQLNTFGFGYDLDSQMLLDLAVEGQGTFAFIPDAVIVGTCFVNSVCNSLSTQTQDATIHLKATGSAEFAGPCVGVPEDSVSDTSWGRVVRLGPLQFGQNRDVVVPMKIHAEEAPYLQATLVYRKKDGKQCHVEGVGIKKKGSIDAKIASCRNSVVDTGYKVLDLLAKSHVLEAKNTMTKASEVMNELRNVVDRCSLDATTLPSFSVDVNGRMSKAIDGRDRFNRWGQHYLRALMRAHQLQLCTNFMDVGLQDYGGLLFRGLRDEGDAIFRALPAPKAAAPAARALDAPETRRRVSTESRRPEVVSTSSRRTPSPDMDRYYAGSGGG